MFFALKTICFYSKVKASKIKISANKVKIKESKMKIRKANQH
jgi:hypothetical protein